MNFAINFLIFLYILINTSLAENCDETQYQIVCYYTSWSIYRPEGGKFVPENINPQLCTKIIYSFAGLNHDLNIASIDTNADIDLGGFRKIIALKTSNPCLKVNLALGGWNEGSIKYSILASNDEWRTKFAENVLKFLAYYGFDGLDLDWEYPTTRGGIQADRENFVKLLDIVRTTISPWGYELSIAVGIEESYYNIPEISQVVDYVHLMAYDFVTSGSTTTGLLAPLSLIREKVDEWIENKNNESSSLDKKKLILGIPTYARCFNLESIDQHDIGSKVLSNPTCAGAYTAQKGYLSYYEAMEYLTTVNCSSSKGTKTVDTNVYSYCNDVWFTYDNEVTVTAKAQYVIDAKLGGIMIWTLDNDDFNGIYGTKYPLLTAAYNMLKKT